MFSPLQLPVVYHHPPPPPVFYRRPSPVFYPFQVPLLRHVRIPPPPPPIRSDVQVRQVWQHNLEYEFSLIDAFLSTTNGGGGPKFVAMDTEFPGTLYEPQGVPPHRMSPAEYYSNMKQNVDALKLIQLGLTISDERGLLPLLKQTGQRAVWEFNFRDFDSDVDPQNPESISMLKEQGIDFLANKQHGIDSRDFARRFLQSRLAASSPSSSPVVWVTFHGPCDFGYLIKTLIGGGNLLPDDLKCFMEKVKEYFGEQVYDLKTMIPLFGLHGGLNRVAESLVVKRLAGKSHQAGSDSLLTLQIFFTLKKNYCSNWQMIMDKSNYKLYGLTTRDYF